MQVPEFFVPVGLITVVYLFLPEFLPESRAFPEASFSRHVFSDFDNLIFSL